MKGLLFTLGLTYGGAVASLFRPYYGFLIYVAFAVLRPDFLWRWSVPPGNYSRIVAISLIVGWALNGFGDWSFGRAKPMVYALLGYLGWQILSGLQAQNSTVAWAQIELQAKIIVPLFIGLTLIDSVAKLKQLAWVIVLTMGFVAYEANMSFWAGNNWLREYGFATMDNNSISIGMVLVAGLAFYLGLADTGWRRWLAFLMAGFMAHVPMFGNSRGGMLGLVVSGLASFVMLPKKPKYLLLFALALAAGFRLAGDEVVQRFSTAFAEQGELDKSAQSRLDLWADCMDVMQRNPVFGVGPNHWPLNAAFYGWPPGKECHSLWFNAGAELGFPGLFLLLAFYLLAIWEGWRLRKADTQYSDPWLVAAARMAVVALCGFMVSASFVSLDNLEPPYYVGLIAAGALKVAPQYALDGQTAQPATVTTDSVSMEGQLSA